MHVVRQSALFVHINEDLSHLPSVRLKRLSVGSRLGSVNDRLQCRN